MVKVPKIQSSLWRRARYRQTKIVQPAGEPEMSRPSQTFLAATETCGPSFPRLSGSLPSRQSVLDRGREGKIEILAKWTPNDN